MCIIYTTFRVNQEVYEYHKSLDTFYSNNTSMPQYSYSETLLLLNFQQHYIMIYTVLMVSLIVSVIIRSDIFVKMTTKASINLHDQMFNSIIRTTMIFFNTNSSGN